MEDELKPCPFCGEKMQIKMMFTMYHIFCVACGADISFFGKETNKILCIKTFNKRKKS